MSKIKFYGWLLTGFFWLCQFNDLFRVKWFFDTLIGDGEVASWLMTLTVEMGMGLFSLDLLNQITANNQRQRRDGKFIGYKQPTALLFASVLLLGLLETFISVAFFYEFGQVTSLTDRLLGGDTLWVAIVFGSISTVLTFMFAAAEGQRTRVNERAREAERERTKRQRERTKKEREQAQAERDATEVERKQTEAERIATEEERKLTEGLPYQCEHCGRRFGTQQGLAGHKPCKAGEQQ